jgi:hypothetical protein
MHTADIASVGARHFDDRGEEPGIQVTPLYVFRQLLKHEKVCSTRWWWLLTTVIIGQATILGGLVTIYLEKHP